MRSRVNKNKELYEKINLDAESTIENSKLKELSQRVNELDSQLEQTLSVPTFNESVINEEVKEVGYDTYENEYLNSFLEEVKRYNLEKGYRQEEDTHEQILTDIHVNPGLQYTEPSVNKKMVEPEKQTITRPVVEDVKKEIIEEVFPNEADTSLEETISMVIQDMGIYDSSEQTNEYDGETVVINSEPTVNREKELLEETMTLKHLITEQEEEIETLQKEKDKTGQMLNITIVLLVFTIIVLSVIIVLNLIN